MSKPFAVELADVRAAVRNRSELLTPRMRAAMALQIAFGNLGAFLLATAAMFGGSMAAFFVIATLLEGMFGQGVGILGGFAALSGVVVASYVGAKTLFTRMMLGAYRRTLRRVEKSLLLGRSASHASSPVALPASVMASPSHNEPD